MTKLNPKKNNYMQTSTGKVANFQLPEVEVTAQSPTGNDWEDRNRYKAYKGRRYISEGRQSAAPLIQSTASLSPIGDITDAIEIGRNINKGNYEQAVLGAGLFLLPNILEKPIRRLIPKKVLKELSLEDVKSWTDKDWDTNYNKAIKEGDNDKIQRIRDLHFMSKVPNNNISIRDGKPTMWFHGSPYAGHTSFNSSVFNNTIGGESALGREKGNFFTTDLNAAKNYATTPSAKSEYSEYTKPQNVKEKLLNIIGLYKPKFIHPINRIPKDLGIDVRNMHNNEVTPLKLMSMSKSDGSKVYQSNKVYPTYINPGKVYTVDFKGNPWSQSPVEFPSKYYSKESYPDVDFTPTSIYPEGHLIEKNKTSDLTPNLNQLKQELQDLDLPYEQVKYDGSGNKSLYSKYRGWDSKLNFKNLLQSYPNYKERPGYSYSIFEHKYPNTTNGAVQYGASEGYNTIHMPNVIDANTGHYENYPIEDLVPLSSNQIKLANPITYDDSGNIIPISKRDNFNSPDIRYGLIPLIGFGTYRQYNKEND